MRDPTLKSSAIACSAVTLMICASGCSSSSTPAASNPMMQGGADAGVDAATAPPPGSHIVTFTMNETIPAGGEEFKCQYVALPAGQAYVIAGEHDYTLGSHHLELYRTDLTAIPAGQEAVADCYEAASTIMSHVRGVIYGAQEPHGAIDFPSGVGLQTQSQEVLIFQTHYINAGAQPLDAQATVNLTLSDGTGITQHAGMLFFYDPFIDVPTGARAQAAMRCPIPNDITLLTASAHYHARGITYSAFLDPASGPNAATPFYTSTDWLHPASLAQPMTIPAGSRVRFNCGYDNTMGTQEYFQGPSAIDNEMCMFVGIYYPDMGESVNLCSGVARGDGGASEPAADMFGTGMATCMQTLTCTGKCPPGSAPSVSAGNTTVDPCWQKCFVDSCPSTMDVLYPLFGCIETNCATECAAAGSSACTSCVIAKCPAQGVACENAACN